MKALLLSVHVLAALILIGPITVAASLFPRYARSAAAGAEPRESPAFPVAAAMHRISHGYTIPALVVPVFGIALAAAMSVLTQPWILVSTVLTTVAAFLLVVFINPAQAEALRALDTSAPGAGRMSKPLRTLAMTTGLFALLWAVVVVLMITRPGSSTGV